MHHRDSQVRVAVTEDDALLRWGIAAQLRSAGFEVVGEYATANELMTNVVSDRPHVVTLDIRLPPNQSDEGIRAAQALRAEYPEIGILILSTYCELAYAKAVLSIDHVAVGYLVKQRITDIDSFFESINRIRAGELVIDPDVVQTLVERPRNRTSLDRLTPREQEVLRLMAEGRSNRSIARVLTLGERTVEGYTSDILHKLDLADDPDTNRRVLAVLALLQGRQAE